MAVFGVELEWLPGWHFLEEFNLNPQTARLLLPGMPVKDPVSGEEGIMVPDPSSWRFILSPIIAQADLFSFLVWQNTGRDFKLATTMKLF